MNFLHTYNGKSGYFTVTLERTPIIIVWKTRVVRDEL